MKLELDSREVQAILLAYAEQKFPGQFNRVAGVSYTSIHGVEFSKMEPAPAVALVPEVAAA